MAKKVLVISTSLRTGSNSEMLADSFMEGAGTAGNEVEKISLKDKSIAFCKGCLACQTLKSCVIKDDMADITEKMKEADVVVLGSPLYWHSMSGAVRNLLDRSYGVVSEGTFRGKKLFFVFQGASPTKEQLAAGDYTAGRYAGLYGFDYQGMATNKKEAQKLSEKL